MHLYFTDIMTIIILFKRKAGKFVDYISSFQEDFFPWKTPWLEKFITSALLSENIIQKNEK
jgi:hypothetical protein